jgi:riboflavin biosynthesis pyrimidine reductase
MKEGLTIFGQAITAKVIDEFFLTLVPQIAGRQTVAQRPSLAGETLFLPKTAPWLELRSVKQAFNHLLLRYTSVQA